jgi:hypothetical protein
MSIFMNYKTIHCIVLATGYTLDGQWKNLMSNAYFLFQKIFPYRCKTIDEPHIGCQGLDGVWHS